MKYRKSEKISDLVQFYLRHEGLETPLNEYRAVKFWPEVVGNVVARHTTEVDVRNQQLHVGLDSPVIRAELMMKRTELVAKLNAAVGANIITEIILK